jgi:hypothetical protein
MLDMFFVFSWAFQRISWKRCNPGQTASYLCDSRLPPKNLLFWHAKFLRWAVAISSFAMPPNTFFVVQQFLFYCAVGSDTQRLANFLCPSFSVCLATSVNVVNRLQAGRPRSLRLPEGEREFSLFLTTQPDIRWMSRALNMGGKLVGEWNWLLALIYTWSLTSTPTHAFMAPCLIKHMDKFSLYRVRCKGSFIL